MNLDGLPERSFAEGQCILVEEKAVEELYFLSSGEVVVSRGGVEIVRIDAPGAVFGEMSFLLGREATATVRATEPCTMKVVTEPSNFLEENPSVSLQIARVLAGRLDSLNRYLVDIKSQLAHHQDHLGMVDDILGSIMCKHPRTIRKQLRDCDLVDD